MYIGCGVGCRAPSSWWRWRRCRCGRFPSSSLLLASILWVVAVGLVEVVSCRSSRTVRLGFGRRSVGAVDLGFPGVGGGAVAVPTQWIFVSRLPPRCSGVPSGAAKKLLDLLGSMVALTGGDAGLIQEIEIGLRLQRWLLELVAGGRVDCWWRVWHGGVRCWISTRRRPGTIVQRSWFRCLQRATTGFKSEGFSLVMLSRCSPFFLAGDGVGFKGGRWACWRSCDDIRHPVVVLFPFFVLVAVCCSGSCNVNFIC